MSKRYELAGKPYNYTYVCGDSLGESGCHEADCKKTSEATFDVRLREKEHTRTHETQVDWLSEWMWHAFFLCMKMSYVCSLVGAHTLSGNVDAIAVCNTLYTPVLTFFFPVLVTS